MGINSPAPYEVNVACAEGLMRIHLINHGGGWRPGPPYLPDRTAPVHDVSLRVVVPATPVSVRQAPGDLPLLWGEEPDGRIVLTVPPIETHCCVEIRW